MSASHTPAHVRWVLPMFGLALGLAALLGLIAILNADAAPPSLLEAARPAALNNALPQPSLQHPARLPSADAPVPPDRTAVTSVYRSASARSTAPQHAPGTWRERDDPRQMFTRNLIVGGPDGLARGTGFAPVAIVAGKVITFGLDGTVVGYTDAYSPVHLVLTRGGTSVGEAQARSDGLGYFSAELMRAGRWAQVQPGDVLQVNAAVDAETLIAPNITGTVNPGTDTVTGQISGVPWPAQLRVEAWGNVMVVTTDAAGNFTANLAAAIDLTWFTEVSVSYHDADGDWLTAWLYPQNGMVINSQWKSVYGYTDPGSPVTVTVNHGGAETSRSTISDARSGWWALSFDAIAPGDIVTALVKGGAIAATLPNITATADANLDRLSGTAPSGMSLSLGQALRKGFTWWMDSRSAVADPGGAYAASFPADQVDALSDMYVFPHVTAKADLYFHVRPRSAVAHWAWNEVYGDADPGALIIAQLNDGAAPPVVLETVQATADGSGYFWASFKTRFQPGYHLLVQGGGLDTNILLDKLSVHVDTETDLITGGASANADLTVNGYAGSFGLTCWDDISANAAGDYQFNLAGILDLRNGGNGAALRPQGNDEDQAAWLGAWCRAPYLEVNETHNGVWGGVGAANVPVVLTLKTAAGVTKATANTGTDASCALGWQHFTDGTGQVIDIAPGDKITFEKSGWSQTVTVSAITAPVDPASERVTGKGPANAWVEVWVRSGSPTVRVPTDATGAFLADFTGLADIRGGDEVEVGVYDGNWNQTYVVGTAPYARANIDWEAVDGWFGPGVTVQYTVTDGKGNPKGGGSGVARADGWMEGVGCGCDLQPGDHVAVQTSTGFETQLEVIPIEGAIDVAADRVNGQMYKAAFPARGNVWVWSPTRNEGSGLDIDIDADGNYSADFAPKFDIRNGDTAEVWYYDANGNQAGAMLYTPYLQVRANRAHDWVQGDATPQTTVFVTVTRGGQIIGTGQNFTGGGTWYHINPQRPDGNNVDMLTGDIVEVTAGELSASVLLIDMDGAVDAATDVVSGKLVGVPFPADVQIEVWSEDGENRNVQTDGAGIFSVDFGAFDISQGDQVGIWYVRPDGHMAGIVRSDLRFEVELRDNDLWGMAPPRSRVDLEIRTPGGALRGQTTVWADQEGNYGTDLRDAAGQRIDIQAGDVISAACGEKHATMTIPQPFSATYDHVADTVCGQAPAGSQMQADLYGYGTRWPTADDTNNYCATFEGDPGIDAEGQIMLDLPTGHRVDIRVRTPTPDLWLNKWSDGQPPSGGYHRYTLQVGNDEWGDVVASGVVLTDTLPAGMTYVSASPSPATVAGNRIIWNLGAIAQGTERDISLTALVSASVGSELENCAEVATAGWESYRGNNTACDRRTVTQNQADLWIGGWISPGDPAPGQEYIYHFDYGNNRPAGSRNVRVTDTLPAGTTFVSEWHPEGWTVDTSQPGKVIWQTDYLPGHNGRYLELRLRVDSDATPGTTQLHNRVEIAGEAPDADLNNNAWEHDAGVQEPYGNVSVGKSYSHGIPVGGYEYTTWAQVWSHGNVPATGVVLTDTLPAGATFVRATRYEIDPVTGDRNLRSDFPPTAQGPGWARWNLPPVLTWREFQMEVTFRIAAATVPGTELINQADVTLSGDRDPNNNHAEYRFRTQVPGPNLRVSKWYDWGDLAPGNTVQYQLRFENDGTQPIYDLTFKDILPAHTTLNGFGWGEQPAIEGQTLTWTPNWQQNPGDQHGFWLQVRVDDGVASGTMLTNTATASTSSQEVRTDDNQAQVALAVGPDLRVEKELLDKEIRPGYRVRYRIRIWNDGRATARNVVLTDTLPQGLTFAGSNWGGDPQGNQVVWHLGDLGPNWYGDFDMEVDAARDLSAGTSLTNRVQITNDLGDAFPSNNTYVLTSTVANPYRIRVQESHNWVDGEVLPGAHVVVVLRDDGGAEKTRFETDAGGDGHFWAPLNQDIVAGDRVEVNTEGTATIVLPVMRIDGAVNAATDRVTGKVYDVPYPATVVGEVQMKDGPDVKGQTDNAGNYMLSFAPFDVRNGHTVALWYVRPDGHQVGIMRAGLFVRVYPADDSFSGMTATNTTVNVTLRDAANNLKGTASVTSDAEGNWGADISNGGARVEVNDHDKVQVTAGGLTANMTVPRIAVLPDAAHDRLEIYSELPNARMDIRWDSSPGQDNHDLSNSDSVTTDGTGHAALDFGPHGGLALGVAGNLYYYDADGQCIEPWWRAMIDAVSPSTMLNTTDHTLTISGIDFKSTPAVHLGKNGVTQVQLTNVTLVGSTGTVLQATVPADTPAGVYELLVYNPDERVGFLADALTIRGWRIRLPLIIKGKP